MIDSIEDSNMNLADRTLVDDSLGTLIIRHNDSYFLVATASWTSALLVGSTLPGALASPTTQPIDFLIPAIGIAALLLGGLYALFYRIRWSLTFQGQCVTLTSVLGRRKDFQLTEITEFKIREDRFRHMPDMMRREIGSQSLKTVVDALQGGKRLFSVSNSDSGFKEMCGLLSLKLPDYESSR